MPPLYSVAMWIDGERYWQFCGEFTSRRLAIERRDYLAKPGTKIRISRIDKPADNRDN